MPEEVTTLRDAVLTAGRSHRGRQPIALFLAASLAAHVALLVALPEYSVEAGSSRPSVFQVTILEPLPVAPPAPAAPAESSRPVLTEASGSKTAKPVTLPALTPPPASEGSFMVAPPISPALPPPPATESGAQPVVEVTPPVFNAAYLNNPAPGYPLTSRRAGEQGTVTLRVMVKRDGLPARVEVDKSSGSRNLDTAAVDAVRGWRFVPARQGTDPIESWVLVPVVFRLEGAS